MYGRKCSFSSLDSISNRMKYLLCSCRILALRKAEKDEEKRAREKIRQKLEEDKVYIFPVTFLIYKLVILYCVFWQGIHYLVIILMYMSKCSYALRHFLLKNLAFCNRHVKFPFFSWLIALVKSSWWMIFVKTNVYPKMAICKIRFKSIHPRSSRGRPLGQSKIKTLLVNPCQ
jgi:hypothetical protein